MKLNYDCIRDVLIYYEDNLVMNYHYNIPELSIRDVIGALSNKYDNTDVAYSIIQLIKSGYLDGRFSYNTPRKEVSGVVTDITWEGHELLNSIRPQTIWEVTKENATKLGVTSIRGVASLAKSVINAIVTNPDVISNIVATIK